MMHYIEIINFSTIDKCKIEIRKLNVLIGSQAAGKSIIAKIFFFFKEFYSEFFEKAIRTNLSKNQLDKELLKKFESIFPRYTWENRTFSLKYQFHEYYVNIYTEKTKSNRAKIKIDYSNEIAKALARCKKYYQRLFDTQQDNNKKRQPKFIIELTNYKRTIESCITNIFLISLLSSRTLFIPASRSFFSNLQRNIFTFLASNIDIDPFVKEFGSIYESAKHFHAAKYYLTPPPQQSISNRIHKISSSILRGEYQYEDEKDWIKSKHGKINIANASSGQQESLPMLLVLSSFPFTSEHNEKYTVFIEEPEAHLFPVSQKSIVSILSIINNNSGNCIFITTHSPYILSAVNVLITASEVVNNNNKNDVARIIGDAEPIKFEDVSAYNISGGTCSSIIDTENKLIGTNVIDEVSECFNAEFDKLLTLENTT